MGREFSPQIGKPVARLAITSRRGPLAQCAESRESHASAARGAKAGNGFAPNHDGAEVGGAIESDPVGIEGEQFSLQSVAVAEGYFEAGLGYRVGLRDCGGKSDAAELYQSQIERSVERARLEAYRLAGAIGKNLTGEFIAVPPGEADFFLRRGLYHLACE